MKSRRDSEDNSVSPINGDQTNRTFFLGLILFSLVYLVGIPLVVIPSTFDPGNGCGTAEGIFVVVLLPIVFYGLIRWLTFPFIRPTARKFHIAAFVLDMIFLSIPLWMMAGGYLSRFHFFDPITFDVRDYLRPLFSRLWIVLPAGAVVITGWSFFSLGRARKRGTAIATWVIVVIYILALIGYIS